MGNGIGTQPSGRFAQALARIDAANARDARTVPWEGAQHPAELVYGRRMSAMLARLAPQASELLRLAVRAQHIERWTVPRASFPAGKAGYHRWRNALKRLHGDKAAAILGACGYGSDEIARVRALIGKANLTTDPEAQTLEDVACLVFLEHHLDEFAAQHERAKTIDILRKTWAKMSAPARRMALELAYPEAMRALLADALQPSAA